MPEIFQDTSTQALIHVIDDNLIEKSLSFARFFGGKIHGPNPLWFTTGPKMPGNNGVVSATLKKDHIETEIQNVTQHVREQGHGLTWWVGPRTSPNNLGHYLQHHNFIHNRDMIGMAIDLPKLKSPRQSTPLKLERVTDRETLQAWYKVILHCFPTSYSQTYFDALAEISLRPGAEWVHYVGRGNGQSAKHNGDIVSASSLFLGAGVAGLYNLGTMPTDREQGYGVATTLGTFQAAREMGYRIGTLQTTYPNALRMYHRMGFEVYCKISIYRYIPEDAS